MTIIRLRDVRSGQRFFEEEGRARIYYIALEDARKTEAGWECSCSMAKSPDWRPVTLFEAFDAGAYRLRLWVDDD